MDNSKRIYYSQQVIFCFLFSQYRASIDVIRYIE